MIENALEDVLGGHLVVIACNVVMSYLITYIDNLQNWNVQSLPNGLSPHQELDGLCMYFMIFFCSDVNMLLVFPSMLPPYACAVPVESLDCC